MSAAKVTVAYRRYDGQKGTAKLGLDINPTADLGDLHSAISGFMMNAEHGVHTVLCSVPVFDLENEND